MSNLSLSIFKPDALPENLSGLNNLFQQSYSHAKKHLQDGASMIHDGINVIKDEFLDIYDKAGSYITNKVVLPVNNFLKDLTQIETELQLELTKEYIVTCQDNQDVILFGNGAFPCKMEQNY
jgi:hypothetical protein